MQYLKENLHLVFLAPIAVVVVLSIAYWLKKLAGHIRERRTIKVGIRAARKAERRRVAEIRRLAEQKKIGDEIYNLLVAAVKKSGDNCRWFGVQAAGMESDIYRIDLLSRRRGLDQVTIMIDLKQRHSIILTDGEKKLGFFLSDGKRWIRRQFLLLINPKAC